MLELRECAQPGISNQRGVYTMGFFDFLKSKTDTDIVTADISFYPGERVAGSYMGDSSVSVNWSYPPRPTSAPPFQNNFFRIYLGALYYGNMLVVMRGDQDTRDYLRQCVVDSANGYIKSNYWAPNIQLWKYVEPLYLYTYSARRGAGGLRLTAG
jgi:hypothetical protein